MVIGNRFQLRTNNKLESELVSYASELINSSYQCPGMWCWNEEGRTQLQGQRSLWTACSKLTDKHRWQSNSCDDDTENLCRPTIFHTENCAGINKGINEESDWWAELIMTLVSIKSYQFPSIFLLYFHFYLNMFFYYKVYLLYCHVLVLFLNARFWNLEILNHLVIFVWKEIIWQLISWWNNFSVDSSF